MSYKMHPHPSNAPYMQVHQSRGKVVQESPLDSYKLNVTKESR